MGQPAKRAAKAHPIKAVEYSADFVGMLLYKTLHGVAPGGDSDDSTKTSLYRWEQRYSFGCGRRLRFENLT
jgi:hypothetical protein